MAELSGSLSISANVITTATSTVSNNELVLKPNSDKIFDLIDQTSPINIKLDLSDINDNVTLIQPINSDGSNDITFDAAQFPDGNNVEGDAIDKNSKHIYDIAIVFYNRQNFYANVIKRPPKDETKPSLSSIVVRDTDLSKIVLVYNDYLNEFNLPASSEFSISLHGITSISINSNNKKELFIYTDDDYSTTDNLAVDYTGSSIEDVAGNKADTFSNQSAQIQGDKKYVMDGASSNEYLNFPHIAETDFDHDDSFSIEFFGTIEEVQGTFERLISKHDQSTRIGYYLGRWDTNEVLFSQEGGSGTNSNQWKGSTKLTTGTLYHIVVTNSGKIFIYAVDDTPTQEKNGLGTNSSANSYPVRIGGNNDNSVYTALNYRLSRIFNIDLTSAQISDLYNGGNPKDADLTNIDGADISANCVHEHKCDKDTWDGTKHILEEEQNDNDGTSVNMEEGDLQSV